MEDGQKSEKTKQVAKKKPAKKKKRRINDMTPEELERAYQEINCGPTPLQKALKKYGLIPEVVAGLLKEETEATKVKVFCTKDGEIVYSDPLVDHKTRQTARADLCEYLGMKPSTKIDANLSLQDVLTEKLTLALERANATDGKKPA